MTLETTDAGPQPKAGILAIAPYVGGRSKLPGVAEPIKLSSNENALGCSPKAQAAYLEAASSLFRYPDGHASELREAVAETFGLEPNRLVFGAGSDEIFTLLNQAYLEPGDNMVTGQYGFLAYKISTIACQAQVREAPEPELKLDVDALLAQVDERTKLVYVSNPSNPTGSFLTGDEVRRLHAELPSSVILVMDEAYAEFVSDPAYETALPMAREAANLVVTRTFSKIHGLAALRIGWGYAPPAIVDAVERIRLPFNTTIPAQKAAVAAVRDAEHPERSRQLVEAWRPRLTQSIRGLGLEVFPSVGNFILVRFKDVEAARAADAALQKAGVLVRGVAAYGLPDCLRITIGTAPQNEAVVEALGAFVRSA